MNASLYTERAYPDRNRMVEILERANEASPNKDYIMDLLAAGYGGQEKYDLCIDLLRKVIVINPNFSRAYSNLGVALQKKVNQKEAEQMLKKAVEIGHPDHINLFNLGSYYYLEKRYAEAKPYLDKAVELCLKFSEAHWNLSGAHYYTGNTKNAIAQLKKIVEIDPASDLARRAQKNLSILDK